MKTFRNRIIIPANNRFEFLIYTYFFEKFYIGLNLMQELLKFLIPTDTNVSTLFWIHVSNKFM